MDFKYYLQRALAAPEEGDKIEYFNLKARVSGNVLVNAQRTIPTPVYVYEADITKFYNEYQKLKEECGYPLSFNTLMMRLLAEGLKVAPRLNAHLEYNHTASCGRLIVKKHIDVAMPIFMDGGITFPVKVRAIEDKSLKEIADQIADIMRRMDKTDVDGLLFDLIQQRMLGFMLKGKVVSTFAQIASGFVGKYSVTSAADIFKKRVKDPESLSMYDFNEGTVCFTNTGTLCRELYGHISYGPLLYPQVFMLGISNIKEVDYPFRNEKGEVDIGTKKMLPITLAFDHRLGGFGDVIPLVKKFEEVFANPEVIHEW
ncbi:MAG: 2-oxo acid dehydrogenase subunit E2 [Clostridia bacterium]|nr:2-oxo acid dehydrogenase subunit E2 [Clostridia bacterium]